MPRKADGALIAGVLVSLKPEFAFAVAHGHKKVELRRRFPIVEPGVRLVIYATKPVGALLGSAPIVAIDCAPLGSLWRKHQHSIGLTRARFDDYFESRTRGYAVTLGAFEPMERLEVPEVSRIIPGFCPPQSWRYVDAEALAALRATREAPRSSRAGTSYHGCGVLEA